MCIPFGRCWHRYVWDSFYCPFLPPFTGGAQLSKQREKSGFSSTLPYFRYSSVIIPPNFEKSKRSDTFFTGFYGLFAHICIYAAALQQGCGIAQQFFNTIAWYIKLSFAVDGIKTTTAGICKKLISQCSATDGCQRNGA